MDIAILTFDGFNELDSFIASAILNRMGDQGWTAHITAPGAEVTSMNGVVVRAQRPLEFASEADVVLVGSGSRTREVVADAALLARLNLDPTRQLIGAQCSGALVLARLGLLTGSPACTDTTTRPWVEAEGVEVLDRAFQETGNLATAGGCLAAPYLAAWVIARGAGEAAARAALTYVAPVGEKESYVERAMAALHTGGVPFSHKAAPAR